MLTCLERRWFLVHYPLVCEQIKHKRGLITPGWEFPSFCVCSDAKKKLEEFKCVSYPAGASPRWLRTDLPKFGSRLQEEEKHQSSDTPVYTWTILYYIHSLHIFVLVVHPFDPAAVLQERAALACQQERKLSLNDISVSKNNNNMNHFYLFCVVKKYSYYEKDWTSGIQIRARNG